jgi:hypothetical protein
MENVPSVPTFTEWIMTLKNEALVLCLDEDAVR